MEGPPNIRGRGLNINGASQRPLSRNKQWLAPGQEGGHTNGSDAERRERGGGPRRGNSRGRGRGRGLPHAPGHFAPHLPVPAIHDEGGSGTEDEGMTDIENAEGEQEVEEKVPDTPEEKERFYQELVKARDMERKKAIAEGKMDDPLVPKRLDEAITMVGTCMDMCPRFERYRRERENNLDRWEVIPGTKRVDHKRAVKIYERAAGDKTLPSDLRPPPVLKKTLNYLFHDLIQRGGFSQTYGFIRDRSRAIRSDFTMQHETGPLAMECHDRCARFHILALHLERDTSGFSIALEEQQLMNTLQSLKEFYEDQRGRYSSPTELEMRIYHRLIHIRDQKERHEDIPVAIASHPVFQLTTRFRLHVQAKSAPISRASPLVVDAEGMQIFAELAAVLREQNNVVMIYLVACILERLFGKDTIDDIEAIRGELSFPEIIDGISRPVAPAVIHVGEEALLLSPVEMHMEESQSTGPGPLYASSTPPAKSSIPTQPSIRAFTTPSTLTEQLPANPVQSAFSNLVSTPNVFGNVTSAFGSNTFGSAFSPAPPRLGFVSTALPGSASSPTGTAGSSHSSAESRVDPKVPAAPSILAPAGVSFQPMALTGLGSIAKHTGSNLTLLPGSSHVSPAATAQSSGVDTMGFAPGKSVLANIMLNPTATAFVPSTTPSTDGKVSFPLIPAFIPSTPSVGFSQKQFHANSLPGVPTLRATAFPSPLSQTARDIPYRPPSEPRIVERRQTLWDLPSTTPASLASIQSFTGPKTPDGTASSTNPPLLGKPAPLTLPPTPTARWFDPSSNPQLKAQTSSLSLRKQSLGLVGLQIPDSPASTEILSPLTLSGPKTAMPPPIENASPTPLSRTSEPVASTSRMLLDGVATSPDAKGKQKDVNVDPKTLAADFARRCSVVRACFNLWKKRVIDRAAWAEACARSDVYNAKVQRHRLSSSASAISNRSPGVNAKKRRLSGNSELIQHERHRRRISSQYKPPVTDDALAKRLKDNQEEYQRRWARGSFLHAIRSSVTQVLPVEPHPPQWRIWLSTNAENDGTAIWLECKFDVPASGEWVPGNIFSIPLLAETHHSSPGSPGLIIFERTPFDDVDDLLEKKYRILDDCARLRGVAEQLVGISQLRFTPALLVLTWADLDGPDIAPDFGDMVEEMVRSQLIGTVQHVVISAKTTDWDRKFLEALALIKLDTSDKTLITVTLTSLCDLYIQPFRARASDWLDSCWTGDQFDWSRYGDVMRSIEELQSALASEILGLLGKPSDIHIDTPSDLQTPSHLGAAYAVGPFLEACLKAPVTRIEEVFGAVMPAYSLSRNMLEASRDRFEGKLSSVSERLLRLAATGLSSRGLRKRRPTDESETRSPTSTNKRSKISASSTVSDDTESAYTEVNGHHTPPPLSAAPSMAAVSEAAPKPQVTIAMLRALAQGVLRTSK